MLPKLTYPEPQFLETDNVITNSLGSRNRGSLTGYFVDWRTLRSDFEDFDRVVLTCSSNFKVVADHHVAQKRRETGNLFTAQL